MAEIRKVFEYFENKYPDPKTTLYYTNAFTLLISAILSAQAMDRVVNTVVPGLFEIADSPEKMLTLGEQRLIEHIRKIGLYRTKAKNIALLSSILIEKFSSIVPDTIDELISLPGVGRKTANIVLNEFFGQPTIPVDTHVFRVAQRIGIARAKTPEQLEKELLNKIPNPWKKNSHFWIVLHGREVCTARNPNCSICKLKRVCASIRTQNNYKRNS
ncbi:endonuclease III [Candidatus Hydrogenosomobacter endosymbioticus]|uniref:Endonuclease III n=1 Tax=Candidatus Hydrogenosomobacter endosymbioticus TaxID=2558174 RepID=A0ABM7V9L1_9PROT|nr:endonuclease III [Candidatus Hydrogenosomobacter endosymbioticus]BDB96458.1 endonuclease III [Candidatus Hydrogenosomobacter endosymbioticus]